MADVPSFEVSESLGELIWNPKAFILGGGVMVLYRGESPRWKTVTVDHIINR
ncbi:MAG: hypothetical protein RL326_921 [Pseudomonadota bacterium]|jgi:hypothetical protein